MFDFKNSTVDTLVQTKTKRSSHVFVEFPEDPELYSPEIHVQEIIRRHGSSEWRAGVLTNELHGHLGIYAIIGVKMGLYANELLGTKPDEVRITSYAGSHPPLSCMNDGLQVSTGATVGHGLFKVAGGTETRPEATFSCWNRSITLQLKTEYFIRIQNDITEGICRHGLHSEKYWEHVRRLAIRYWLEFDRHNIFYQL